MENRLREILDKEGINQIELAHSSDLSIRTVRRAVLGETRPSGRTKAKIILGLNEILGQDKYIVENVFNETGQERTFSLNEPLGDGSGAVIKPGPFYGGREPAYLYQDEDSEIIIEFQIDDSIDDHEAKLMVLETLERVNKTHITLGGKGLKIEDIEINSMRKVFETE